jgi:hypothetical protein
MAFCKLHVNPHSEVTIDYSAATDAANDIPTGSLVMIGDKLFLAGYGAVHGQQFAGLNGAGSLIMERDAGYTAAVAVGAKVFAQFTTAVAGVQRCGGLIASASGATEIGVVIKPSPENGGAIEFVPHANGIAVAS